MLIGKRKGNVYMVKIEATITPIRATILKTATNESVHRHVVALSLVVTGFFNVMLSMFGSQIIKNVCPLRLFESKKNSEKNI